MTDKTEAQRLAKILEDHYGSDDTNEAAAELRRLESRILTMDRIMRASVPDRWKSCTSPVGAVQSYIAELELECERLRVVAPPVPEPTLIAAERWAQLEHMWSRNAAPETIASYIGRPERLDYIAKLRREHEAAVQGDAA